MYVHNMVKHMFNSGDMNELWLYSYSHNVLIPERLGRVFLFHVGLIRESQ